MNKIGKIILSLMLSLSLFGCQKEGERKRKKPR